MADLLKDLEAVALLDARATPGKVELHTSCSWRRIIAERNRAFLVPTIDPDRHQNMDSTENAQFVVALVNWYRTHHAEIEAAVRDARGERSESWEVWQDDMCVAGSDSFADANHYLMMYGQDGPVKLVRVATYRETITPEELAAMHNSAREG